MDGRSSIRIGLRLAHTQHERRAQAQCTTRAPANQHAMASRVPDASKAKEAQEELKLGNKA